MPNNRIWLSLYNVVSTYLMMFIRAKKKGNKTYYYIVETTRIKEKVHQKAIKYIGTAESLLEKLELLDNLLTK